MAPVVRRKREKEQRKKAILKASQQLFFKKGFKSVSVESIAKQARLSKGTVYLYFSSKEEIYAQILLDYVEKFNREVANIAEIKAAASEMITYFADIYIRFFLEETELFRIFMMFMLYANDMNFSDEVRKQLISETNLTIEIIDRIFWYGIDTGEFLCTEDIKKRRNALWGLLNGVISLHLFTGHKSTRERRVRSTAKKGLEIFIEGLKNPVVLPDSSGK